MPGPVRTRQYVILAIAVAVCVGLVYLIRNDPNGLLSSYLGAASVVFGLLGIGLAPMLSSFRRTPADPTLSTGARVDELATALRTVVRRQFARDGAYLPASYIALRWEDEPATVHSLGATASPVPAVDAYLRSARCWVLLGAGGAGKSTLMLRLQEDLLEDGSGPGLPIVFPLATRRPNEPFHDWLARVIADRYPALGLTGDEEDLLTVVRERVLPILEGLDEISAADRADTLRALNRVRRQKFILTSRVEAYREQPVHLTGAVVSTLCDLRPDDVAEYLTEPTRTAADDWRDAALGADGDPVRELLTTPVAVRLIGDLGRITPDELRAKGTTRAEIDDELFGDLVADRLAGSGRRWTPAEARRWLGVLARYVDRRVDTVGSGQDPQDIGWHRLADELHPAPPRIARLATGLIPGAAVAVGVSLVLTPVLGRGAAALLGVLGGLLLGGGIAALAGRGTVPPTTVEFGSIRAKVGALAALLVASVTVSASVLTDGGVTVLAAVGIVIGAIVGLPYALVNEMDVEHAENPRAVFERDRRFVWVYTLVYGLPLTAFGLLAARHADLPWMWGALLGVFAGAAGGLFNGLPWLVVNALTGRPRAVGAVAWARFQLARLVWRVTGPPLPWRLLTFLDDCVEIGLLRRVGAVYQFRNQRYWEAMVTWR